MQRPQDKRIGFNQGNQLGKRPHSESSKKMFSFASGKTAMATRIVVKADDLESKTAIHPLNPRRQASLTADSVRDILPSIKEEGVYSEGVALRDEQGIYQLLDSSRRRFACLQVRKELPLWVIDGEVGKEDLVAFIQTTQSVKRLSYRELGANYQSIMDAHQFKKIDELAEYLVIGRETCRKRFVAAAIDQSLIEVFPDCEGIPNSYYARLAKVDKLLTKEGIEKSHFIKSLNVSFDDNACVEDKQKSVLEIMESQLSNNKSKVTWDTESLAQFDDKNKYAKVSRSSDKRGLKIELSRLPSEVYEEIIQFVSQKVKQG